ncbi:MAG: helix-turn-helix transcriptional regulator [Phycisphaerales bacterium]
MSTAPGDASFSTLAGEAMAVAASGSTRPSYVGSDGVAGLTYEAFDVRKLVALVSALDRVLLLPDATTLAEAALAFGASLARKPGLALDRAPHMHSVQTIGGKVLYEPASALVYGSQTPENGWRPWLAGLCVREFDGDGDGSAAIGRLAAHTAFCRETVRPVMMATFDAARKETTRPAEQLSRPAWHGGRLARRALQRLLERPHRATLRVTPSRAGHPDLVFVLITPIEPFDWRPAHLNAIEAPFEAIVQRLSTVFDLPPLRSKRLVTPREREVAIELCRGRSTERVAEVLQCSAHTVNDHIKKVHKKLDVQSRAELVARLSGLRLDDAPRGPTGGRSAPPVGPHHPG